ncbi:hypothetical protein HOD29_06020 [archaeon]|jgi:hypothetical protein|nr:hypothetical protein [archaeon]
MDIQKRRHQNMLTSKSRLDNYSQILFLSKLKKDNETIPEPTIRNDYISKLKQVKKPKKGYIVTLEENFIGSHINAMGIITKRKGIEVLSQEYDIMTKQPLQEIIDRYGNYDTEIKYYNPKRKNGETFWNRLESKFNSIFSYLNHSNNNFYFPPNL